MFGVYVHIPWCRLQCPYCAFTISVRRDPPHRAYTDALIREWELRAPAWPGRPSTVYFGGGTPSLCPPREIARILAALDPLPDAEISLEANPATLAAPLSAFRDAGVTRLSLGVQSFDPWVARRLGRGHSSDDARALVEEAQATGFRSVSFDLIFAVPGQGLDRFSADLATTVSLAPDHVSLYGLTIEEGTPFARSRRPPVDEDTWRAMYDLAVERLGAAGIARYEVSNFARPGHRSRHNELYWRARPWVGLGVGAHGWQPDGRRTANLANVEAWLADPSPPPADAPTPEELATDLIWSTLRHVEGLDRRHLRAHTGLTVTPPADLVRNGLIEVDGDRLLLTHGGFPLADAVTVRLLGTLRPAPPPLPTSSGCAQDSDDTPGRE